MASALKFGARLKELRVHLCQTGTASKGVRDFVESHYVDLKKANANLPILIRECSGVQPRLWARFEKGQEQCVSLADLSANDVLGRLKDVARSSQ